MKHAFLCGVAALLLAHAPLNAQLQTMSHEEEVVRNAYAKVSFICGLPPLTKAASDQLRNGTIDQAALEAKISEATPVFDLNDFQTGTVASIANERWGQFVSPPLGGQVLESSSSRKNFSDSGVHGDWFESEVHWRDAQPLPSEAGAKMLAITVAEAIALGSPQWSDLPVTYTRYAAFTVSSTYKGKSSGPHRAIFFFGKDPHGNEVVAENDLISGPQALWDSLKQSAYPSGLLQTKLRETPVIADWIRANEISSPTCQSSKRDLCCVGGKCGLSQSDVNKDLSSPLP